MAIASEGKFVWFDYVSADVQKAAGFYGELFNWKTQEIPGPNGAYTMLMADGQGIGGMWKAPPEAPQQGHWLSLLSTSDINASADKLKSLGGKVLKAPTKFGEFGTMAIVSDSLGGAFGLWQDAKPQNTGDYKGQPGFPVWNELLTQDVAKSVEFYTKLAGFTEEKMDMGKMGSYHILNRDGKGRAGVMKPPMDMPQAWMPYIQVANTDQTIEKAKKLGATIILAGEDIPGVGRLGVFADPLGGSTGVLQPAPGM